MSQPTKKPNSIEDAFKRAISKDSMAAKTAEPPGMAGKVEALEAAVLTMRGDFKMFRHETGVELSRLDEFEDRMDFLTQEVQFDGEDAYSQEDLTLSELMTGGASRRPIVGKRWQRLLVSWRRWRRRSLLITLATLFSLNLTRSLSTSCNRKWRCSRLPWN